MKVLTVFLSFLFLLTGCNKQNDCIDKLLSVRSRLNESGCEFYAQIRADYGEYTHTFGLECRTNEHNKLVFTVQWPETIKGISGIFDNVGGRLTFDDNVLAFSPLSEGLLTPVAAPWVFYSALKGGYINCGGTADQYYKFQINDTYQNHSLMVEILTDSNVIPVCAEIYWDGYRIISMEIEAFRIL